ncbi:MAG: hypothetical protein WC829_07350 [Hyphomicrobium sp.]|jgi:hypothetical protein
MRSWLSRDISLNGNPLPAEKLRDALARIDDWRLAPYEPVACPVCGAPGLVIEDRSTRPYAEWYALSCPSCGLGHTIHIPMSPAMPIGE